MEEDNLIIVLINQIFSLDKQLITSGQKKFPQQQLLKLRVG